MSIPPGVFDFNVYYRRSDFLNHIGDEIEFVSLVQEGVSSRLPLIVMYYHPEGW